MQSPARATGPADGPLTPECRGRRFPCGTHRRGMRSSEAPAALARSERGRLGPASRKPAAYGAVSSVASRVLSRKRTPRCHADLTHGSAGRPAGRSASLKRGAPGFFRCTCSCRSVRTHVNHLPRWRGTAYSRKHESDFANVFTYRYIDGRVAIDERVAQRGLCLPPSVPAPPRRSPFASRLPPCLPVPLFVSTRKPLSGRS